MRHVDDTERRARLAQRHALVDTSRCHDVVEATRAMTVLHATEPASVHLAAYARTEGLSADDVDRALYDERTLVKQLAMRRTLFVFPIDLLPAAWGSACARVAAAHGTRLAKDVRAGLDVDGERWVADARSAVLDHLDGGDTLTTSELRDRLPALRGTLPAGDGRWDRPTPVAPRVLTQLNLEASVVRAHNRAPWWRSAPTWSRTGHWTDAGAPVESRDGYAELVRRWLRTFGPGTETDLVWWLGSTKGAVRTALADLGAVQVSLDGGPGWLLPDDLDPVTFDESWVALLPVLDPTTMGWKQRDFYLGPHAPRLFDSVGNGGTTAWVDGRVVGCWVQGDDGVVRVRLEEEVPTSARRRLDAAAERLTVWLAGRRGYTMWASPAMGPRADV